MPQLPQLPRLAPVTTGDGPSSATAVIESWMPLPPSLPEDGFHILVSHGVSLPFWVSGSESQQQERLELEFWLLPWGSSTHNLENFPNMQEEYLKDIEHQPRWKMFSTLLRNKLCFTNFLLNGTEWLRHRPCSQMHWGSGSSSTPYWLEGPTRQPPEVPSFHLWSRHTNTVYLIDGGRDETKKGNTFGGEVFIPTGQGLLLIMNIVNIDHSVSFFWSLLVTTNLRVLKKNLFSVVCSCSHRNIFPSEKVCRHSFS